jgi:predicted extracellular nuclease
MHSPSTANTKFTPDRFSALPGKKPVQFLLNGLMALMLSALATSALAQNLVINEVLQNPNAVSDGNGEWFELYNPSGSPVDIEGWTFQDNDFDSFVVANGGPLLVPAGGYLVLGNDANFATNGGVNVDYEFSGMALGNSADELVALDGSMAEIDRIEWDGGSAWPDPTGASMSLDSPGLDNNVGSNWCEATTPFGSGDLGTPGAANTPCGDSPPEVSSTTPADSAVDVALDSNVAITFSEAVTADGGSFSIVCSVSGTVSFATGGGPTTYTLDPDADFVAEQCTVTVLAAGVADQDGSPLNMTGDFEFSFTTIGFVAPLGDIVINEILQNPSAVSDGDGEWFELHNRTDAPIDIDGWTIEDNDSDDFVIANGGPLEVPAGGFVVLGNNGDFASNGGVNVDYEYSGMFLSNGSDELVVRDGSLVEVDRVEWDNGATFPDPNGSSMSLISPVLDNNIGGNWCTGSTVFGVGDRGTPGASNDCIDMIINEIIQNPSAVSDGNGEWFEVYNPTTVDLDINGWTIKDDGSNSHVIDNGGPLNVPAGGFAVLGRSADSSINGGVSVDYAYGSAYTLSNGEDEVVLLDLTLNEVDRVNYDGGPDFPDPNGASMALIVQGMDNNVGASWCTASTPFGDGDFGTPGAENDCGAQEIFTIQGAGLSSPFDGFNATTEDNSVFAVGTDGFFMQTPGDRTDADVNTSDGIWVYTDAAPGVDVGDRVDVSGPVDEQFGFTRFNQPVVTPNGTGDVPAVVVLNAAVPSDDPASPSCAIEYECYEGMFVSLPSGLATGPTQSFGSSSPREEFHVVANGIRTFRETGVEFPGLGGGIPTWDGNPEVFEVDPDKLGAANVSLNVGSTVTVLGGMAYEFGDYEIWASDVVVNTTADPVAAVRAPVQGEMTVGSLNMLNLSSGASDFDNRIAKLSNYVRNILGTPDVLAVQEVQSLSELTTLASTIDVGFLVGARVETDAITQLGADELLVFDGLTKHDRPPLLFEGRYTGNGMDFPLAVLVVHMRSLINIEDPAQGDRVRNKRLEQAQSVATMAQDYQTANPGTPFMIVGDFNAFEFTDGYVDVIGQMKGDFDPTQNLLSGPDLVDPNLVNQVDSVAASQRYSFVFQGSANALDHALTNTVADTFARGLEFGRGNADAIHDSINDIGTPNRSSDHDGVVLYLMTDFDGDGFADDEDLCPYAPGDVADQPNNTTLLNGCAVPIPATDYRGLMLLVLMLMTFGAATIRRNVF